MTIRLFQWRTCAMVLFKINIPCFWRQSYFFCRFFFFFFLMRQDKEWRKDSIAEFFYLSTRNDRLSHQSISQIVAVRIPHWYKIYLLPSIDIFVAYRRKSKMPNSRLIIMFEHFLIFNHQRSNTRIYFCQFL